MNTIRKISVFGDSILKGVQINPATGRYHVDNHIDVGLLSRTFSLDIGNYSRFGCTVTKGEQLIERYLAGGGLCDAIVMDFGGNDCDFDWKAVAEDPAAAHTPHTPPEQFAAIYRRLIGRIRERGITPILTNLPPLQPQRFFDWFCGGLNQQNILKMIGDVGAIFRHQAQYSAAVECLAAEEGLPLVDLRGAFLRQDSVDPLLCADGTHPTTAGQALVTQAFVAFARHRLG